jgi:hypothetical protein
VPAATVPETPGLVLMGLIFGEKDGIAVFVDQTTRAVIRLRTNEGHSGWTLRSIRGREAILEKAPFRAVLQLPRPGAESSFPPSVEPAIVQNQQQAPSK